MWIASLQNGYKAGENLFSRTLFVDINRSFYRVGLSYQYTTYDLSYRDQPYFSMQGTSALVHAMKGE
jgi:hypothetical protein